MELKTVLAITVAVVAVLIAALADDPSTRAAKIERATGCRVLDLPDSRECRPFRLKKDAADSWLCCPR